jgi:hypothetical protein
VQERVTGLWRVGSEAAIAVLARIHKNTNHKKGKMQVLALNSSSLRYGKDNVQEIYFS